MIHITRNADGKIVLATKEMPGFKSDDAILTIGDTVVHRGPIECDITIALSPEQLIAEAERIELNAMKVERHNLTQGTTR